MLSQLIRRICILLVLPFLITIHVPAVLAQDSEDQMMKIVYHADFADPRRFSAMLTSIYNMATTYENDLADYDIRIVFVAHGIRFLTDDKLEGTPFVADGVLEERRENLRGRLKSLVSTKGVKLELCDITRTQIDRPKEAFYKSVKMVTSGVVRITELQRKGFAYLKIE